MNTPTDIMLDDLVARLNGLTGHQWQRYMAWEVKVAVLIDGAVWNYGHSVTLRKLDADPVGYAALIAAKFNAELEAAKQGK